jgi:4-hydroxymandelate oxidase
MTEGINLFEIEQLAKQTLPAAAYDYYAGGAHDELTLADNRAAYDRLSIHYRVLRDVSRRDLATTVLGIPVATPILVAPTAFQRLAHPDGEIATARAAARAGTIMTLSTLATTSIEDLAAAASAPWWFQLYVYRDRGATRDLVQRAEAAGCSALVLTVDAQVWGVRERDVRNRFSLPPGLKVLNLAGAGKGALPEVSGSGLAAYVGEHFDPALSWQDLEWLCSVARVPVVVKGIVRGDDARRAADSGAGAVQVSNHGGRQLDTAPATIDVLPEVVEALKGAIEVFVDGGVRRGTDVLKALAWGARAVAIGRPVLWGLATDGEAGVSRVLDHLRDELDLALALSGYASPHELPPDLVRPNLVYRDATRRLR